MPTNVEAQTRPLTAVQAKKLGIGIISLRRKARELKKQNLLTGDSQFDAELIAASIIADDQQVFNAVLTEDGRDWESFFAALVAFIEKIMPLILLFLG